MPRNNADFQAGMFHGTSHNFSVGDHILPANKAGVESLWDTNRDESVDVDVADKVYATDDHELAQSYADFAAEQTGGSPSVYRVEPIDLEENLEVRTNGTRNKEFVSNQGFKVVERMRAL